MSSKRLGTLILCCALLTQIRAADATSTTCDTSAKTLSCETASTGIETDETFSDKTMRSISKRLNEGKYDAAGDLLCLLLSNETARQSITYLLNPGNRTSSLHLEKFEEAKRFDIAEKILRHYIKVESADKVHLYSIFSLLLNKSLLARTYARQGKTEPALRLAKEVCSEYSARPISISANANIPFPHNPPVPAAAGYSLTVSVLFSTVDALIKNGDLVAAKKLNNRLETRIAKELGPKNLAHALYLKRAATIAGASHDTHTQSDALMKAFRIEFWNAPVDTHYRGYLKTEYCKVLSGYGNSESAKSIEETPVAEPDEIPNQTLYKHTRQFFGGVITTHSPPADAFADTAEAALLSRLNGTDHANPEPPFAVICDTLNKLIDFYAARRMYPEAQCMLLKKLELFRSIEGNTLDVQSSVMEQIAEICYLKGDRAEALRWLNKAEKSDVCAKTSLSMRCAALRLEMGDRDKAKKLLLRVANDIRRLDGPYFSSAFCYLLAHAGLENLLQNSGDAEQVSVQDANPNHMEGWWQRVEEPCYWKKDGIWIRETRATRLHQRTVDRNRYQISEANRRLNDAHIELAMLVNHDLPAAMVKEREPEINQKIAASLEQLQTLEDRRLRLLRQEDELRANVKDFATARITALQQAEDARRAEQLEEKAMN